MYVLVDGRRRLVSELKGSGRESKFPFPSPMCVSQAFKGLDGAHPPMDRAGSFTQATDLNAKSILETISQTHLEIMFNLGTQVPVKLMED